MQDEDGSLRLRGVVVGMCAKALMVVKRICLVLSAVAAAVFIALWLAGYGDERLAALEVSVVLQLAAWALSSLEGRLSKREE